MWGGAQAALIKRAILNFWNFVVWRGERLEMADCCSCCEGGRVVIPLESLVLAVGREVGLDEILKTHLSSTFKFCFNNN